ncbi:MAG TPA: hypothetical protein QGG47_10060 [Acidobacteriota bacterium]|nr:hypothetical protein [Acidobacteriota bacterium]
MCAPRSKLVAAVILTLTLSLAVVGSQRDDEFFDSSFDGAWVGSIKVGGDRVLVQLNLNIGNGGVGFVVIQDNLGGIPSGVDVLVADFTKVGKKKIQFRVDDEAPLRRQRGTTKFKLKSKAGKLKGRASGAVKGSAEFVPMSAERPLQKLWAGTVKIAGATVFMLLQFIENENGTVGGHAVVNGETGEVVANADRIGGRLAGVSGTIELSSGDLGFDLSLQKGNN